MKGYPIEIRKAKRNIKEAYSYACLQDTAANGGSALLYGRKWKSLLAHLYMQSDSSHSYQYTWFAYVESDIVGHITSFLVSKGENIKKATAAHIFRFLGLQSIRPLVIILLRRLAGIRLGQLVEGDYFIGSIAVSSKMRNTGIGSMLISTIEKNAKENSVGSLSLEVDKMNRTAVDIYSHWGFHIERESGLKNRGIYFMRKYLNTSPFSKTVD